MLLLGHTPVESLFVATAILATSVGISVKVLQDLGLIRNRVAYFALGAAVLDDILALMVLAVVRGLASGRFQNLEFTILVIESIALVGFLTWMGPRIAQTSERWLDRFKIPEAPFVVSVILCLGLAELAHVIGLTAIIASFMAGVVIDELTGVLFCGPAEYIHPLGQRTHPKISGVSSLSERPLRRQLRQFLPHLVQLDQGA